MRLIVYLMLSAVSLPAFAAYTELRDFLRGTTWCFQDQTGPRAFGRIQFYGNGTGKFDVFDAPGSGGIALTWSTWENWETMILQVRYASGFKNLKQSGEVLILDDEEIMVTWREGWTATVSLMNRCPAPRSK